MKMTVIGHAHINLQNRNDFLEIPGIDTVDFLCPAKWRGSFDETYNYADGFPILHIPLTRNGYVPFLQSLNDSDILWIDEEPYLPQTYFILRQYKDIPVRIVRTAQNIRKNNMIFNYLYRYTYTMSTEIVGVGETSANLVSEMTGKERINIIPLSIDEGFFNVGKHRKYNLSKKLRIGYAARLDRSKGTEMLIDIIEKLNFPFKLIIAGSGPEEHHMKMMCDAMNLDYEFRGFIKHSHMPDFYNDIDVFINLSRSTQTWIEQQGRTVIEAAAAGSYVISTNSGELAHVMENLGVGLDENDKDGFFQNLAYINENREAMKKKISDNMKNARRFSSQNIGKSISSLLREYGNSGT